MKNTLVSGTVLDEFYVSFPYYKLVYHNQAVSKLTVIVKYDILANKLTILSQSAVGIPPSQPAPPVSPPPTQPINPCSVPPASSPTSQPTPPPVVGGYEVISNPTANPDVVSVLSFLINNLNSLIQYASLLKAESQLVNGNNYKLTISYDTASSAYYVIVVYRSLSGQFSITSVSL